MATCKTLNTLTSALDNMQNANIKPVFAEKTQKQEQKSNKPKSNKIKNNRKDGKISLSILVTPEQYNEWSEFFENLGLDKATGIRLAVKNFIKDVSMGKQFSL